MTEKEKVLLYIGVARLELDIRKQRKSLELTSDMQARAYMENIVEGCKFTQKKIYDLLGETE